MQESSKLLVHYTIAPVMQYVIQYSHAITSICNIGFRVQLGI